MSEELEQLHPEQLKTIIWDLYTFMKTRGDNVQLRDHYSDQIYTSAFRMLSARLNNMVKMHVFKLNQNPDE